jgi:hypothetical protein
VGCKCKCVGLHIIDLAKQWYTHFQRELEKEEGEKEWKEFSLTVMNNE